MAQLPATWPDLDDASKPQRVVPPKYAYHGDHPTTFDELRHNYLSIKTVSERVLHMDRYRAAVRHNIPQILHEYFGFPDTYLDRGPYGGTVPQTVELIENMFEGGSWVANFATDHTKSIGGTYFFPILSLMDDPDEAHIIVGANINDSKRRIQMIQRTLEGAGELDRKLLQDFPWLRRPPKESEGGKGGTAWSRTELTVSGRSSNKPNPSIYACATGSNDIRGRRGKLIMDDIEGEEHRHFAQKRQMLYDFVKLEGVRCKEDVHESNRPLLIALGTPFDQDSIYFRLEREQWKVMRLPAYTVGWKEIMGYQPYGETAGDWIKAGARIPPKYFSWPLKRMKVLSQDPYFGKGMTKAQFSIAYLLDPSAGDPSRLSLEDIERLMRTAEFAQTEDWKIFVSIDPASGSKTRFADYCGISVVKLRWPRDQKLPEVQVLECHKFEQGITEQVDFAAGLSQQYQCDVMYESNSQQKMNYRNVFHHRHPTVRLVEFYTKNESKEDTQMGLTIIKTLVRSGKLKVPQSQLESEGVQSFMREVRDLGGQAHDHIACSIWFPVRWFWDQVRVMSGPTLVMGGVKNPFSVGSGSGGPVSWNSWRRR